MKRFVIWSFIRFNLCEQYLQFTCTKILFSEAVPLASLQKCSKVFSSICRLIQKPCWRFSLFYDIFLKTIFQMLPVIEAPITILFQPLVKQIFVVIAEAFLDRCSTRKIIWSIPVINVQKNNFINNGKMSWGYFSFILFSFDQNLNSP